jgi:hypothetical protein
MKVSRITTALLATVCAVVLPMQLRPFAMLSMQDLQVPARESTAKPYDDVVSTPRAIAEAIQRDLAEAGTTNKSQLPLFTFTVQSPKDGNQYNLTMVGQNPFKHGKTARIRTFIVPLIIQTNTVGLTFDEITRQIGTVPGMTTFDPTLQDSACMMAPNNVPLTVFQESPVINSNHSWGDLIDFDFGGKIVKDAQYVDAFQRGNLWQIIREGHDDYHTLLDPVEILPAITVNVPSIDGTTLPPSEAPTCGPYGVVDIVWFRNYVTDTLLPNVATQGVNSSNFPIFLLYNVELTHPVTNLTGCCTLGYHGATGEVPLQTYSVVGFDSTNLRSSFRDVAIASHEVAEWMNDPFGNNRVPAWGHVGQQSKCQSNLEVGDPLSGTNSASIVMPNGFTYHLQELAFFSWFFGEASSGIHGWYSDNGTFLDFQHQVCQ